MSWHHQHGNCLLVKSSFGKSGAHLTHEPRAYPGVSSEIYLPGWGEYTCDLKCNRFLGEEDAWTPFVFIALLSVDSRFDLGKRGRAGMTAQVISRDQNQILTNRCVLTWRVVWTTAWVTSMRDCLQHPLNPVSAFSLKEKPQIVVCFKDVRVVRRALLCLLVSAFAATIELMLCSPNFEIPL